jgi:hypothetical protein
MELSSAFAATYPGQRAVARFSFEIRLAAAPADALALFTPEGERAWDPQWNPTYASATVFMTDEHTMPRVWIIDDYNPGTTSIAYTVFAAGRTVTRIAVKVRASGVGSIASVSYHRTSINAAADAEVSEFAMHGDEMRAEWQTAIDAATRPL